MNGDSEHERIRQSEDDVSGWRAGVLTSATVPGARSARTTVPTATPGRTSRTTWPKSRYRWGEDGIAGLCDRYQVLVFAPAFWNGRGPILKERLFGLNSPEGNHGEDVKEYYYYLDGRPSHAYMKFLYEYPQAEYPYNRLIEANRRRTPSEPRIRADRHGDLRRRPLLRIVVEYPRSPPRTSVSGSRRSTGDPSPRGSISCPISGFATRGAGGRPRPEPRIALGPEGADFVTLVTDDSAVEAQAKIPLHYQLGPRTLYARGRGQLSLHRQRNEHVPRFRAGQSQPQALRQGRFHRYVIKGERA